MNSSSNAQVQSQSSESSDSAPKKVGAHPRIVAFMTLATVVTGLGYLGQGIYHAVSDSWMAPINLSPDTDAVIQINVKLNEQLVARDKLKADIERIDGDVKGIDVALSRLQIIQKNGQEAMKWSSNTTTAQSSALHSRLRSLGTQHELLDDMLVRQTSAVARARKNLDAGLLSAQELERELQVQDELKVSLTQNERDSGETKVQSFQLAMAASALRNATNGRSQGAVVNFGVLPEVAAGQEREVRVDLELIKLASERRSLVAQRTIATESLDRMEDVFKQLKSRPLYRAVQASTDVAFVPYTQMEGVEPGAELVSCRWTLFQCRIVGRVAEVLPGEVVAQDPWSDVARGQYAILDLADREASKEKVIRARRRKH